MCRRRDIQHATETHRRRTNRQGTHRHPRQFDTHAAASVPGTPHTGSRTDVLVTTFDRWTHTNLTSHAQPVRVFYCVNRHVDRCWTAARTRRALSRLAGLRAHRSAHARDPTLALHRPHRPLACKRAMRPRRGLRLRHRLDILELQPLIQRRRRRPGHMHAPGQGRADAKHAAQVRTLQQQQLARFQARGDRTTQSSGARHSARRGQVTPREVFNTLQCGGARRRQCKFTV